MQRFVQKHTHSMEILSLLQTELFDVCTLCHRLCFVCEPTTRKKKLSLRRHNRWQIGRDKSFYQRRRAQKFVVIPHKYQYVHCVRRGGFNNRAGCTIQKCTDYTNMYNDLKLYKPQAISLVWLKYLITSHQLLEFCSGFFVPCILSNEI